MVDAGDEGAKEEHVDEGDEDRGAFGRRVSDEGVEAPEDGDDAYDKENEDVGGGDDVGFEESIYKVGLRWS